ncbi:hypothetical protein GCM10027074_50350 [Streptomyces deserti]
MAGGHGGRGRCAGAEGSGAGAVDRAGARAAADRRARALTVNEPSIPGHLRNWYLIHTAQTAQGGQRLKRSCGQMFQRTFRRAAVGEVTDTMIGLRGGGHAS